MDKEKEDKFEISEMFMARADNERCFFGTIKRWKDTDGNPLVFSRIHMPDGHFCAQSTEQVKLARNLD